MDGIPAAGTILDQIWSEALVRFGQSGVVTADLVDELRRLGPQEIVRDSNQVVVALRAPTEV